MDVKLNFNNEKTIADINFVLNGIETDDSLRTAVIISLFTDSRDEGEAGWWAVSGFGSKLWKLKRAKTISGVDKKAETYAKDALEWMLQDGIAKSVRVTSSLIDRKLKLVIYIEKPDGEEVPFEFENIWRQHREELENGIQ